MRIKLFFLSSLIALTTILSCKKDDHDTSGGDSINQVRELEVFIDGNEWETDNVYLDNIYGRLKIQGNTNGSRFEFLIDDFQGSGDYLVDNQVNYMRYYPSSGNLNDYFFASNDTIQIASFPTGDPYMVGGFSFEGQHSTGSDTKSFTNGKFNGIDSLKPIPTDIFNIQLNEEPWSPKSLQVSENSTTGTLSVLAQSISDQTYVVIRIPLSTTPGTYELNDLNYNVEYQVVDGNTYQAFSGQIIITENDFFNSQLSGSFQDLTLLHILSGETVNLSGNFDMDYQ